MASAELDFIVTMLAETPVTPASTMEEIRTGVEGLGLLVPALEGSSTATVDAGGVPARWVAMGDDASADDGASAVILHFHGGGYVMAGSHTHVGMLSRLASGSRRASAERGLPPGPGGAVPGRGPGRALRLPVAARPGRRRRAHRGGRRLGGRRPGHEPAGGRPRRRRSPSRRARC